MAPFYADQAIVARTHEIIRGRGSGPRMTQPTRGQLLAALKQVS